MCEELERLRQVACLPDLSEILAQSAEEAPLPVAIVEAEPVAVVEPEPVATVEPVEPEPTAKSACICQRCQDDIRDLRRDLDALMGVSAFVARKKAELLPIAAASDTAEQQEILDALRRADEVIAAERAKNAELAAQLAAAPVATTVVEPQIIASPQTEEEQPAMDISEIHTIELSPLPVDQMEVEVLSNTDRVKSAVTEPANGYDVESDIAVIPEMVLVPWKTMGFLDITGRRIRSYAARIVERVSSDRTARLATADFEGGQRFRYTNVLKVVTAARDAYLLFAFYSQAAYEKGLLTYYPREKILESLRLAYDTSISGKAYDNDVKKWINDTLAGWYKGADTQPPAFELKRFCLYWDHEPTCAEAIAKLAV